MNLKQILVNLACCIDVAAFLIAVGSFTMWISGSPIITSGVIDGSGMYIATGQMGIAFGAATLLLSIPAFIPMLPFVVIEEIWKWGSVETQAG